MRKKGYIRPAVLRRVTVSLERDLLRASVITGDATVEAAGQTADDHDHVSSSFNHVWE